MFAVGSAASFGSLSDPTGSSVLVAAVSWLQGTLLGTLATTVAVIAVATVGLMMLAGRVNLRHGVTVVAGIQSIAGAGVSAAPVVAAAPVPPPPALPPLPPANPDPYAGASVPAR